MSSSEAALTSSRDLSTSATSSWLHEVVAWRTTSFFAKKLESVRSELLWKSPACTRQPEPTGRTALQLLDVRRRAHAAVDEKGRRPIGKEPQKQRQGELKGDEDVRAEQRLLKARRCGLLLRVVARELYERLKVDRRAARLCRKRRTEFGTLAAKD